MSDELKSAYELAMERLAAEGGEEDAPTPLTNQQKESIAAVRAALKAKLAELEIVRKPQIAAAEATGRLEEAETMRADYDAERAAAEKDAESEIASIRASGGAGGEGR